METNQSLGLAPTGSAVQVTPTSPETLDAEMPDEWRRGATAAALGDCALLPIIEVRFHHHSTINDLGEMKLTASKMSRAALASANSRKRIPRDGRGDGGTGSCKSGKDESRDDFELHIVLFSFVLL